MSYAVSRLADDSLWADLQVTPGAAIEIPHIRGVPVPVVHEHGIVLVREWPNIAGRLEAASSGDIVRWDRELAPDPDHGRVIARGVRAGPWPTDDATRWFRKLVRSLEQYQGVVLATPFESTRALLLTPWGTRPPLDGTTDDHWIHPVPATLSEFPGGVILTFRRRHWIRRKTYADTVHAWFAAHAAGSEGGDEERT